MSLGTATHATLGTPATTTVTIDDNDGAPTVSMKAPTLAVAEAAGSATVCATMTPTSSATVTVDVASGGGNATAGTDYTALAANAQLRFSAGDTEQCVAVAVADDAIDEANETFTVTLSNPTGGNAELGSQTATTVTIEDDDTKGITVSDTELDVTEGSSATYTVVLASQPTGTVTVTIAGHAGTDVTLADDTLTFTPSNWNTTQTVTVRAAEDSDAVDDPVTLTHTGGGADYAGLAGPTLAVTVDDNDTASSEVTLTAEPDTVTEGAGGTAVTVTATLDGATRTTDLAVTVAVAGDSASTADFATVTDFTVTIPANAAAGSAAFTLTPTDDTLDEPDETLTVTGTAGSLTVHGTTLTITDNDDAPTLTTPATLTVAEAADAQVCATLNPASGKTVTVPVTSADGNAAAGTDYTAIANNTLLAFDPGVTEACVTVSVNDDALDEPDETFTVSLGTPVDATLGTTTSTTVTITDNDAAPTVAMANAAQSVTEAQTTAVCAALTTASGRIVSVGVSSADGGAEAHADYTPIPANAQLTFDPGTTRACVDVATLEDTVAEAAETFTVSLGTATHATLGTPATTTVTIDDNDGAPTVSMKAPTLAVAEAAGSATVCATMTPTSSATVTVDVASGGGNATAGTDYTALAANAQLRFSAGDTEQCVAVAVADDAIDEANETFTVTLSNPTGGNAELGSQTATTVTIEDDDTKGITVSDTELDVTEGSSATYTVVLASQPTGTVTVTIAGHAGTDVTLADDTLTFTPSNWNTTQTVTVRAAEDSDAVDDPVTLTHTGGGADYAGLAGPTLAVTVDDNDTASSEVTLTAEPDTVTEGAGGTAVTVTATLDGATRTTDLAVTVAVAGDSASTADFATVTDFTVTIPANAAAGSAAFTLTPTDDTLDEPDETLTVTGTAGSLTVHGTTLTITDNDDAPTLTTPATLTVAEAADAQVCATLNPASGKTVTVPVTSADGNAAAGTDYTAIANNTLLAFDPGVTEACVTVSVNDDALDEPDETFTVSLGTPVDATLGTTTSTTVTITDNDAAPTVAMANAAQSVTEAQTTAVCAALTTASGRIVSVGVSSADGGAEAHADYTPIPANAQLTFDPGTTRACVDVATLEDTVAEAAETFTVSLGTATHATLGTPATTTVTIDDNDGAPTVSMKAPTLAVAEAAGSATVCATMTPTSSATVTVDVASGGGNATAGTDYTALAANAQLRFSAGDTEQCVAVAVADDAIDEANETFTVTLSNPTGGNAELGSQTATTVTIEDDDTKGITVSDTELDVTEGSSATYTVVLASQPTGTVTVTIAGHAGTDVTLADDTLTFTPSNWNTTQTVTVRAAEDSDAVDDPVTLTHTGGGADYAGLAGPTLAVTVDDNDTASSEVTLTAEPDTVTEGAGGTAVTVTATLDGATRTTDLAVTVAVAGDSASTADFATVTDFTVTIPANAAAGSAAFTLTPTDDTLDEPDETLTVTGTAGSLTVHGTTLTITDNDSRSFIKLVRPEITEANPSGALRISESDDARVCVNLERESGWDVTVGLSSIPGTALAGNDYVAVAPGTTLTVQAGDLEKCTTVDIVDDGIDEDTELFSVELGNVVNAILGDTTTVPIEILDNDAAPTVAMANAAQSVTEAQTTAVCAALTTASGRIVSVGVSSADGGAEAHADYTPIPANAQLTFDPGTTRACVDVATLEDTVAEAAETFTVSLGTATHATLGTPATTTVTIDDNDGAPTVSMKAPTLAVAEAAGSATVCATMTPTSSATVTVDVASGGGNATAGTDYTALAANAQLRFSAGDTEQCVAVAVADDAIDEANETFTVTLSNPTGGNAELGSQTATTVTIEDDDTKGITVSDTELDVTEGSSATYTVVLASQPTGTVTVTIAGHAGTDVTLADDTLTFTPSNWNTTQTVTVRAAEDSDAVDDPVTLTHTGGGADYAGLAGPTLAVTVDDNDTASSEVTLTAEPDTVTEGAGGTAVTVTATLDGATRTTDLAVTVAVAGDSASTADFATVTDFTVTIPANAAAGSAAFTLTPTDDTLDEPDETLTVTGTAGSLTVHGTTLTITDNDDAPTLTTPATLTVAEAADAQVCATLNPASGKTVTVPVTSADGNAAAGTDYTAIANNTLLAFDPGVTEACVTVSVNDDALDEPDETFTVSLGTPVDATLGTTTSTTVTITDNDAAPTVAMANAAQSVTEAQTTAVCAALTTASGRIVSVGVSSADGGAEAHADYTPIPANAQLTFDPGTTRACVDVATLEDTVAEAAETFTVSLGTATHATLGTPATTTVTIDDNDGAPTVSMKAPTLAVAEAAGSATVCATMTPTSSATVTVDVASGGGNATAGTDYTALAANAQLRFSAGDTEQCVAVAVADDAIDEANETFTVTLSNPTGGNAELGSQTATTVTIEDDDTKGITVSDTELDVTEGSSATYTVVLASQPTGTVTVTIAGHAGTDVTLADDTLTFTPSNWNTTQTVTVRAAEDSDAVDDPVTLTHTGGGADYAGLAGPTLAVTVDDNDTASSEVTLTAEPDTVTEGAGGTAVTVTATLDGATRTTDLAVTVAVAGDSASTADFATVTDFTVTIPANAAAGSAAFTLTPTDDTLDEPDETLTVTGTAGSLTVHGTTLTITDNDDAPTLTTPATLTVAEAADAQVCATLNPASGKTVTVPVTSADGNAAAGTDYTAIANNTLLAFDPGVTEACVTVSVNDDALDEPDETFTVSLGTPVDATLGTTTSTTVTITDNDAAPTVAMANAAQSVTEAQTTAVCAALTTASGRIVSVGVSSADGGAEAHADYTPIPANAQLTFDPGTTRACVDVATLEDTVAEAAETFTVSLGTATHATLGTPATTTVTIDDNDGAPTVSMKAPTLAVAEAAGSATVCATMTPTSSATVTVDVASGGGNATAGTDYTALAANAQLRFSAGDTEQCVAVAVADDAIDEANETFTVTLSNPTGGNAELGSQTATTVTIEDDDTKGITVSDTELDVTEGSSATYTVVLASQPTGTVTVTIAGHAGTDVTLADDTLTFTPSNWNTTQTVTVRAAEDSDAVDDPVTLTHTGGGADYAGLAGPTLAVTVDDNDTASSEVTLTAEPDTVTEGAGGTAVTVTATLDGATRTTDLAVTVAVAGDSASTADFATVTDFTVTIPANAAAGSAAFTLTPTDDTLDEPDETLTVTGTAGSLTVHGTTLTITDNDDAPTLTTPATLTVAEAADAQVCATLNPASGKTVTVPVTSADGNAAAGTDYTAIANNTLLAFDPGVTEACVTVSVNDDALDEPDETFTVSLGTPVDATLGTTTSTTVTITDNDAAPTVAMANAAQSVTEAQTTAVCAALTTASGRIVSVGVSSADGGAEAHADYTPIPANAQLTFDPGTTRACVDVATLEDTVAEAAETFTVSLGTATHATLGTPATTTVTIDDNDGAPTVSMKAPTLAVAEAAGSATVCATMTPTSSATVTVDVASGGGNATAGTDYTALAANAQLRFSAGDTEQCVAVAVADDAIDEANETFTVTLSNPTGGNAELGSQTATTVTIEDDDTKGITVSDTELDVTEGSSATYTVVLASQPTGTVTIYPQIPDDANASLAKSSLTFTPTDWNISQDVEVTANEDADSAGEEFEVTHQVSGADYEDVTAPTVYVIVHDTNAASTTITLSAVPDEIAEGAAANGQLITITATLNASTRTTDTSIQISVHEQTAAADDFDEVAPFTVTIAQGNPSGTGTFTLFPIDDDLDEGDEILRVAGSTSEPSLTVVETELTIVDDDDPPQLSFAGDVQVTEADTANVCVNASFASGKTMGVTLASQDGTADAEFDYSGVDEDEELTFSPGQTYSCLSIETLDDSVDEANETFFVSLVTATNATIGSPSSATVTIVDDDAHPIVQMAVARQSVTESLSTEICSTLQETSEQHVVVRVTSSDGTAEAGLDYSAIDERASLSFAPGTTRSCISVSTLDDALAEQSETFTVSLFEPTNAILGSLASTTVTIDDNDGLPRVTLSSPTLSVGEATSKLDVCATISPIASNIVSVGISTQDATAMSGEDFVSINSSSRLTFGVNESVACRTVTIIDDMIDEGDEEFLVLINNPTNAQLGSQISSRATIVDDDDRGVSVHPTSLILKPGDTDTYEVTLKTKPTDDVTVEVHVPADVDATVDPSQLSFTEISWHTAQTVNVTLDADSETTMFTLTHTVKGGDYEATAVDPVKIVQEEKPIEPIQVVLSLHPTSVDESEASNGESIQLTASFDGTPRQDEISLEFLVNPTTASPQDFQSITGFVLTIPAGSNSAQTSFNIFTVDDDLDENDEQIEITATTDAAQVTIQPNNLTIVDDDTRGVLVNPTELTISEGMNGSYEVSLFSAPTDDVVISISSSDDAITLSQQSLQIDQDAWAVPHRINITANEDLDAESESVEISHFASGGDYTGISVDDVNVKVVDDDVLMPILTFKSVTCLEKDRWALLTGFLSSPAPEPGFVSFRTVERSAKPQVDYMPRHGVLEIPARSITSVIAIPIVNDGMDEMPESFIVEFHSSQNVQLERSFIEVKIVDDDLAPPVYNSWLGRYGRTIAQNVVDTVQERVHDASSGDEPGGTVSTLRQFTPQAGSNPNRSDSRSEHLFENQVIGLLDSVTGNTAYRAHAPAFPREISWISQAPDGTNDLTWTFWGRMSKDRFAGNQHDLEVSGNITSNTVGVDVSNHRWLVGTTVSVDQGDGVISGQLISVPTMASVPVKATSTLIAPYAQFQTSESSRIWLTGGYAEGNVLYDQSRDFDVFIDFGAFGSSSDITKSATFLGVDRWFADTDFLYVRTEGVPSFTGREIESTYGRFRATLEGRNRQAFNISNLASTVKMALRYDIGDLETGVGFEMSGGLSYNHPTNLIRFRGDAHVLALHQDSEYQEWGLNAELTLTPQAFARTKANEGIVVKVETNLGSHMRRQLGINDIMFDSLSADPSPIFSGMSKIKLQLAYPMNAMRERLRIIPYIGSDLRDFAMRHWYFGSEFISSKVLFGSIEYLPGRESATQDEIWIKIRYTP